MPSENSPFFFLPFAVLFPQSVCVWERSFSSPFASQRYKVIEQRWQKKTKSHRTKHFSYSNVQLHFSLCSVLIPFVLFPQHFDTLMLVDEILFTLHHILLLFCCRCMCVGRQHTLLLLLCGVVTATCFSTLCKVDLTHTPFSFRLSFAFSYLQAVFFFFGYQTTSNNVMPFTATCILWCYWEELSHWLLDVGIYLRFLFVFGWVAKNATSTTISNQTNFDRIWFQVI